MLLVSHLAEENAEARMHLRSTTSQDPGSWDVAIVGTGIGGATLGHALAMKGLRVLFLEKGRREVKPVCSGSQDPEVRLSEGFWPGALPFDLDGKTTLLEGMRGCAVGGSTRVYGALLERMEEHDF